MNVIKPKRGDVWLADFDPLMGREQGRKRPCIVLSIDDFNRGPAELAIVIPLTSVDRKSKGHVAMEPPEGGLVVPSYALCEQIRALSYSRLSNHSIGRASQLPRLKRRSFTAHVDQLQPGPI